MSDDQARQTKLADALVDAEAREVFDPHADIAVAEAINAICEELDLPRDQTEQGLTPEARARIDDFAAANRSEFNVTADMQDDGLEVK